MNDITACFAFLKYCLGYKVPYRYRRKDVTALRCSEPLRSKVGGTSKPSPYFAGWDRQGRREFIVNSLQFIIDSLLFIFGGFGGNWLMSCRFLAFFSSGLL